MVRAVVVRRIAALGAALAVGLSLSEVPVSAAAPPVAPAPRPPADIMAVPPLPGEPGSPVRPEIPAGDFTVSGQQQPQSEKLVNAHARIERPPGTGYVDGRSQLVERRPTGNVYRNPDGTLTAKLYTSPVNVKDRATGDLVPVDSTLEFRDGAVRPKAAATETALPQRTSPGAGVRIDAPDGSDALTLTLEGLANRPAELAGATATYHDVQPDVDLTLQASPTGVKQTYVLRAPVAEPSWTLRLRIEGDLTPAPQPSGAILLNNRDGRPVLVVPAPVMFDSPPDGRSAEPAFGPVSQRLERDAAGWRIVVSADPSWIADPARRFPISVDPGVHILYANQDAFVSDAFPSTNYNVYWDPDYNWYINKVGYYPGAGTNIALLGYDPGPFLGKQIIEAIWHGFWVHSYSTSPTNFYLRPNSSFWLANDVRWANRPTQRPESKVGYGVRGQWSDIVLTDWIAEYAAGRWPWHGFAVDTGGAGTDSWKKLAAAEAGPDGGASALEVTYNDPPGTPANLGCASCAFHTRDISVGVRTQDPNNDPRTVEIYLSTNSNVMGTYHASFGAQTPAGVADTTWRIPSGVLEWNRTYYWQARVRDAWSNWVYSPVWNFRPANVTPPTPALLGPADQAVVTSKQPTLSVAAVADPDGDAVQYEYSIATGTDGRSGMVATSGWIDGTSWTVPVGVLKDGVTYSWTVRTRDVMPDTASLPAVSRRVKIDLRLGAQGPVPGDSMGPVNVNLSTGNVITSVATPAMNTVGGPVSVSLTYNSLAVDETGLVGSYFAGDSTIGIADTDSPVLVRTDPQISFDWGDTSPYPPVLSKDAFRIRWQGYVTVPVTGSYVFGGQHDAGMRVWLGADKVYDAWLLAMPRSAPPRFDGAIARQLSAGTPYPIRVETHEGGFEAFAKLWAKKDADAPVLVPSSWLSPSVRTLPPGWSVSADVDGTGAGYTKATLTEGGVTLTDSTGASHGYTKLSDGGYAPPPGEYGTLSRDEAGNLTLIDGDGTSYEFNAAGGLVSITSPADARRPAAARMEWTTLSAADPIPRLTRMVDPVSDRAITLHYAGDGECGPLGTYETPPPGHLCAIKLPDGAKTVLYYGLGGKLVRFLNPGSEATDFGYTADHLLDAMRTPLALDWIMADVASRNTLGPNHLIAYDTSRRASWVKAPEPSGFERTPSQRPRHDYTYGADWTEVDVAGLSPATGYARRITRDSAGRMLTDTDATGETTRYVWWHDDSLATTTDPAGRVTHIVNDAKGNPMHRSGPAPANCFSPDRIPIPVNPPPGCDRVAYSITRYDEGMTGLAGTWWTNPNMAGAAHSFATAAPNGNWNWTPPAEGLSATGAYSGRMTGQLQVDTPGTYYFGSGENDAYDGVRVYVDDNQLLNRVYPPTVLDSGPIGYWRLGDLTTSTTAMDVSGAGRHGTYSTGAVRGALGALPDDGDPAADFPDGRVTIPDADALDVTGPLTIEAWVKPRHHTGGWHDLISKYAGSDTANLPFELAVTPEFKLEFRQGSGGTAFDRKQSTHAVVPNAWSHIAVTRDAANKVTFFINGARSGEATMARAAAANTAPLALGRRPTGGQAQAWLDEVAIYDKALPEKDIDRHIAADGPINQGRRSISLTAGTHRFRVEYVHRALTGNQTRNASGVDLAWKLGTGAWSPVPADRLTPDYGLVTSTTEFESDGVPDQVTTTRYTDGGWDPAYGIATSTVTDPGGLALTTRTAFEQPGTGFLRRLSRTMPTGAQNSYAYYGNTETRDNPCTPIVDPVIQAGLEKTATLPTPASGPARVDEQVYDLRGRVVADQVTGTGWACTSYDARDRVSTKSYPENATAGARTVVHDYAVGGDPLVTSVSDPAGTVTTRMDLLGRVVSTTDVHGTRTEPAYDLAGRVVTETVTPPNPADSAQVMTFTYDDAGRILTQRLGTTVLADVAYTYGELAYVLYSNDAELAAIRRNAAGHINELSWSTTDGGYRITRSTVARTRSSRIVDEFVWRLIGETIDIIDPRPDGPNYAYDAAGRLTEAWTTGHRYNYDLTSTASATCPTGTRANAAANTNRARLSDTTLTGTVETSYCYDAADRLLATTGTTVTNGVQYDAAGNTTEYTAAGTTTYLGWDTAGRNLTARASGADPAQTAYTRDATDRITRRTAATGDTVGDVFYSYTGTGDTADLALAGDKRILTRSISLPGGVLYTIRGNGQPPTWNHPTVRGDLFLGTGQNGTQVGDLRTYTPYGDPLTVTGAIDPDADPDNQPGAMDYGWLGQHQRPHEHAGTLNLVQMGARPYSPVLGRFLSVDPIEGGSANSYDYASANPISNIDVTGAASEEWTKRAQRVAERWNRDVKEVREAIHRAKHANRDAIRSGRRRNPDIEINVRNGDVRVEGTDEVIDNLNDYLEFRSSRARRRDGYDYGGNYNFGCDFRCALALAGAVGGTMAIGGAMYRMGAGGRPYLIA